MSVDRRNQVGLAIVLSMISLVLFDLMGLVIKRLSADYDATELTAYRNIFGMIPSLVALWSSRAWHKSGRGIRIRQWPLACSRGLMVTIAQLLYYYSLGQLAFATATTITYANALFMTALAIPILGEKVGLVRWSAVLIGFAGVMLIVKPGHDSFSWVALAPLGAAFIYALAGVTARLTDEEVPSPLINLYSSVVAAIGAILLTLFTGGFSAIANASDFLWILAMGGFGGTAVLLMVVSFRMTEQSNLAAFSYFGIPIAFILGWMFFDEAPIGELFPGAILIVFGGLLVVWRERQRRRAQA
jgi:drug/metabolite transporter (DMT)-like permease